MGNAKRLVDELHELTGAIGSARFAVVRGGVEFDVAFQLDPESRTPASVTFSTRYDVHARSDHAAIASAEKPESYRSSARQTGIVAVRPLAITLRAETPRDVVAKLDGLNAEYQTGDDAFDREVYISTPTTDARVLAAVLGPRVRTGVRALLDLGFEHVKIDEQGGVEAYFGDSSRGAARRGGAARALESFALVLADLPRVVPSGGVHPPIPLWARTEVFFAACIGALALGLPGSWAIAGATQCRETDGNDVTLGADCGTPAVLAFAFSIFVALAASGLARPFATARLRGTSDSARRITGVRVMAFLLTLVATYLVVSWFAFIRIRH